MLTGATRSRCEWTHRERAGEDAAVKRPEILTSSACALKMSQNPDPAPATNSAILSRKFNEL